MEIPRGKIRTSLYIKLLFLISKVFTVGEIHATLRTQGKDATTSYLIETHLENYSAHLPTTTLEMN